MVGVSESSEYKTKMQPSIDASIGWMALLGVAPAQTDFDKWVGVFASGGSDADFLGSILATSAYAQRVG